MFPASTDKLEELEVADVSPMKGEYVELKDHEMYIRYSADNWAWCVGESTETIFDCDRLEKAYQGYKALKCQGDYERRGGD